MDESEHLAVATREIDSLHVFFEDWFVGRAERDLIRFERDFLSRFAAEFSYVMPSGARLVFADLTPLIYAAHASNPDFRIEIHNVAVVLSDAKTLVVTYEEHQRGAKRSAESNHRFSTAVFVIDHDRLVWRHLQETWLAAGD